MRVDSRYTWMIDVHVFAAFVNGRKEYQKGDAEKEREKERNEEKKSEREEYNVHCIYIRILRSSAIVDKRMKIRQYTYYNVDYCFN